jgi:Trk K+ transport system NAD-binding subunit
VVVSFNEISEKLIRYYLDKGEQVLLIDIDPDVYDVMHDYHMNLCCVYADIYDPDTWDELQFSEAATIISCMVGGQEAEVSMLRWRKEMGLTMPLIATTDSHLEALELYKHGATYVIQTEELAAESFQRLLEDDHELSLNRLAGKGKDHHQKLTRTMMDEPAKVWGR